MIVKSLFKVSTKSECNFPNYLIYNCSMVHFKKKKILWQNGIDCKWMDTREVLIVNPTSANQVDPDYLESEKRLENWYSKNPSQIIIATGFIASTPQNIPTTLKRDGSDFSAAIMGALCRAGQVTIWTDVDGVYSADPRKGLYWFLLDAFLLKVILRIAYILGFVVEKFIDLYNNI